ncbi:helix-turn-helix transcriptional regulator [Enterococcus faecalis]|uniref:helix-turn-helix domain-containing protein n=1 Tax=Enterococcus faecalis TaxID=1351 RepID=UPI00177EA621|nr:helix-turn-helix transcriptional regulator [Enterococcus faecalis]MBD9845943.1 helix-turn-helix transcriptional regulator [Enterococcus faecalis]
MTTFERIKKLAKQKDKNLQQVARELKYGENYFYSLNAGKHPTAEKLQEIANYFNVSVDYLLGRTDNIKDTDSKIQRPKVKMLARKMDKLDDSQLDAIDGLIDNFFDKKFNKKD